jgi:peroxiredoxin
MKKTTPDIKNRLLIKCMGVLSLLLCASAGYSQQFNTTIQGTIEQLKPGTKIYYQWDDKDRMTPFSDFNYVESNGNKFTIHLYVKKGDGNELILSLGNKPAKDKFMFLYVDSGLLTVQTKDSLLTHIKLGGSEYAVDLQRYHDYMDGSPVIAGYQAIRNEIQAAASKKDTSAVNKLKPQLKQLDSVRKVLALNWINNHRNSTVCAFIMKCPFEPLSASLSREEEISILNKLSPEAKNNGIVTAMEYDFNIDNIAGVGKMAPDFTQVDTSNKQVSLKDFRGKYVLLDFWASWCGPCRAENPDVVKAYKSYQAKGFTVISVSLDRPGKQDDWMNAIHHDHLTWTNVSDLKFWGNLVAKLYGINEIPSNFLIGPDGKILAKNLHGDELDKTLAKILVK